MREYDQRFVYRKVFASRVDRGTQTNEGESELLGPWVPRSSASRKAAGDACEGHE
jgi:hypothetical protein